MVDCSDRELDVITQEVYSSLKSYASKETMVSYNIMDASEQWE